MPVTYRHTQVAWAIIVPADLAALACLYLAMTKASAPAAITFFGLLIMTYLFYGLTVIGTQETLEVRFGIGLIRKRFRLSEILTAQPYRTSLWQGWGIRTSGDGLILNVSGYEAVRITMTDGKRYIIGTDEPIRLLRFLEQYGRKDSWSQGL